ncbi:GMC oxidoreductase [Peniophora sp. CONT]|nr:GMC oxidoreductase [Peniophora sp. CONT]
MWPFTSADPVGLRSLDSIRESYDYIIIGGGTAGCVLARRLSENATVLLVERGDGAESWYHRNNLLSFHHLSDGKHSEVIQSEKNESLNGSSYSLITGKGLGGSTRINAGQYTCGVPGEYNAWAQAGDEFKDWSYEGLKPYFKKHERWIGPSPGEFHGADGPLPVRSWDEYHFGCAERMAQAAEKLGFLPILDMHSPLEPSFGCNKMQYAMGADGTRQSSYRAFIPPSLIQARKDTLHVCTGTIGAKLYFEKDEDGELVATSALLSAADGSNARTISAKREIVLTAGALRTPQILLLSGVGPTKYLESMGIETVLDSPGVGQYLQDHCIVTTCYNSPLKDSLWAMFVSPTTLIREIYNYVRHGSGYFLGTWVGAELFGISSLINEDGSPLPHPREREDSSDPANIPDFGVMSSCLGDPSSGPTKDWLQGFVAYNPALLVPKSKGQILLRSTNPLDQPICDMQYLSHPDDRAVLRTALRVVLALVRTMKEQGYPLTPVCAPAGYDDASLDAHIDKRFDSMLHYSSSCRMAPREDNDGPGVVDAQLRVYGVRNLRIADASVLPVSPSTHPQALVYAVAEKCADMMLKDAGLS